MEGRNADTINASIGAASIALIQRRLVMSTGSGFDSSAVTSRGSSVMPQIGHEPGALRSICGCIGQVYLVCFPAAGATDLSSVIPHLGQLPGPGNLISGCIGHVYSPCAEDVFCVVNGDWLRIFCTYFPRRHPKLCPTALVAEVRKCHPDMRRSPRVSRDKHSFRERYRAPEPAAWGVYEKVHSSDYIATVMFCYAFIAG